MNSCARFLALAAAVTALFAGCTPKPKTMPAIDARNIGAYNAWRSAAALQFGNEPWAEFDATIQELRIQAMTPESTGSAQVAEALCRRINGLSFRQAMLAGYQAKLDRLEIQRSELKRMVDGNALILPKPGDVGSEFELNRRLEAQKGQLKAMVEDIAGIRQRITELGGHLAPLDPASVEVEPAKLSRREALAQISMFLTSNAEAAAKRYGRAPIQFHLTEAKLASPLKEEFAKVRAAAQQAGRTAIAVQIDDQFLIFDQVVDPLTLPTAITANLTESDIDQLQANWATVQAEFWARKQVADQSAATTHPLPVRVTPDDKAGPPASAPLPANLGDPDLIAPSRILSR